MTPKRLLELATMLCEEFPEDDVELIKNQVGNLSIGRGDKYLGYIDLRSGEMSIYSKEGLDDD